MQSVAAAGSTGAVAHRLASIRSGTFLMGSNSVDVHPDDGEGPARPVLVGDYRIDPYVVSNDDFAEFVAASDYRTEAEQYGWSFVFEPHLAEQARDSIRPGRVPAAPWWVAVSGASWLHPEGPGSQVEGRGDHPVVHVSWNDAVIYAGWAGTRLPSEAEWERAARGGLVQSTYPWGDQLLGDDLRHRCNIWQGRFPDVNTAADGYTGTAPVDAFEPNGFGLYNMSGNVWEWCSDAWSGGSDRVLRGGSFLCHDSYCNRYRVSARTRSARDSSTSNTGFRVAADA